MGDLISLAAFRSRRTAARLGIPVALVELDAELATVEHDLVMARGWLRAARGPSAVHAVHEVEELTLRLVSLYARRGALVGEPACLGVPCV